MRKTFAKNTQLASLVDMYSPKAVMAEAGKLFAFWYTDRGFEPVRKVFGDVLRLYSGKYPGYRACNTRYHDAMHITDSFLAMARLLDGYNHVHRTPMPERMAAIGLTAALLHDAGFIQGVRDRKGTGAKYTSTHVDRSIAFIRGYFPDNGFTPEEARIAANALLCTDLCVRVERVRFRTAREKTIGFMLGSADLLGQMASRCYLERLLLLYGEFREAGLPGYRSRLDMLRKTLGFSALMDRRLDVTLGDMRRYLRPHFRRRFRVDKDLYREAMAGHIRYLRDTVLKDPPEYKKFLRRASRGR